MLPGNMAVTSPAGAPRVGHLLIIGVSEEKFRQRLILSRFLSLSGGPEARLVVISTASSLGDEATDLYQSLIRAMGVADVRGLRPLTREEANDPAVTALLADVTGIFMTGGNQLPVSRLLGDSPLGRAIRARPPQAPRGPVAGG